MLLLCIGHMICSMPHVIYSYVGNTYDQNVDHVYNVLLAILWIPFGYNFVLYVAQKDQYWDAYKFYVEEKLRPMLYKQRPEDVLPTKTTPFGTTANSTPSIQQFHDV